MIFIHDTAQKREIDVSTRGYAVAERAELAAAHSRDGMQDSKTSPTPDAGVHTAAVDHGAIAESAFQIQIDSDPLGTILAGRAGNHSPTLGVTRAAASDDVAHPCGGTGPDPKL